MNIRKELQDIRSMLCEIYTEDGADSWLYGPKKSLGGKCPLDLFNENKMDELLDMIERLKVQ